MADIEETEDSSIRIGKKEYFDGNEVILKYGSRGKNPRLSIMRQKRLTILAAPLNLTNIPMDVFKLITDHLLPTGKVLLGLTCHQFYSLFREQIATTSLIQGIWKLNARKTFEDMNSKEDLQLHEVLRRWSGLAGYKYFDATQLHKLDFGEQDNLLVSLSKRVDLITRTGETEGPMRSETKRLMLEVQQTTRRLHASAYRYNSELRRLMNGNGGRSRKQRMMGPFTQIDTGLFFKYPLFDGSKSYSWHNLPAETQRKIMRLVKFWIPDLDVMKRVLDVHRRLRWSEHMMNSYAEWMQLVDF